MARKRQAVSQESKSRTFTMVNAPGVATGVVNLVRDTVVTALDGARDVGAEVGSVAVSAVRGSIRAAGEIGGGVGRLATNAAEGHDRCRGPDHRCGRPGRRKSHARDDRRRQGHRAARASARRHREARQCRTWTSRRGSTIRSAKAARAARGTKTADRGPRGKRPQGRGCLRSLSESRAPARRSRRGPRGADGQARRVTLAATAPRWARTPMPTCRLTDGGFSCPMFCRILPERGHPPTVFRMLPMWSSM